MTRTQFYLYASASISAALAVGLVWYARAATISRRTGATSAVGVSAAAAGGGSNGAAAAAAGAVGGVAHAAGGVISGVLGWIGLGGGGGRG